MLKRTPLAWTVGIAVNR